MAEATLGELARLGVLELGDGYRTRRDELDHHGFRIIRVADVRDHRVYLDGDDFVALGLEPKIGAKVARAGDVLLTTKGTVGRVAVMPETDERCVYSPQLCYFRVAEGGPVDARFLSYWLQSTEFSGQASYLQGNTDMAPYISLTDLRSTRIALRPLDEQRAIAEVLGALDDKIAANTKLAATAEDLALAIASTWPVAAPVSDVATLARRMVKPESVEAPLVAHFSLPAYDAQHEPVVEPPASIQSAKFEVERPSVLISKLNPRFPRVWNLPKLPAQPALASTEFVVLEPRHSSTSVLWALLAQPSFGAALEELVSGTSGSHQRVKPADILGSLVADPRMIPESEQERVESLVLRAGAARAEHRTLASTRDALLPALMSGRLTVEAASDVVDGAREGVA